MSCKYGFYLNDDSLNCSYQKKSWKHKTVWKTIQSWGDKRVCESVRRAGFRTSNRTCVFTEYQQIKKITKNWKIQRAHLKIINSKKKNSYACAAKNQARPQKWKRSRNLLYLLCKIDKIWESSLSHTNIFAISSHQKYLLNNSLVWFKLKLKLIKI